MVEEKEWKIAIGQSNFKNLMQNKECYFVDKTLLIKDVIDNSSNVALITRPRRFGKTLNMSMLKYYFSIEENSKELFEGLKIMNAGEKYTSYLNNVPTIFLTFNGVKTSSYEELMERLKMQIADLYQEHRYILENEKIFEEEKEDIKEILFKRESNTTLVTSIKTLSKYLNRIYDKPVLLLVDEYDVPIQSSYTNGYYEEAIAFFKNFYADTFKDNPYIWKTVITGVSRVAKEGLFTGANNFDVYTVLNSPEFSDDFGILEEELELALKAFKLEERNEEVKEWYDGYKIGNTEGICNTWSTINFLQKKELMPYWVNTSSNDSIKMILKKSNTVKQRFIELLQGKEIEVVLDEETILLNIEENENNLWGLLLGTGYLKVTETLDTTKKKYKVKLPNKEISLLFEDLIERWFDNKVMGENLTSILKDLVTLNMSEFTWKFKKLVLEMFSFFDVGMNEAESFYHAFVLGLLVGLKDEYYIHSNRESGEGRYDIEIEPKDVSKNAFILEFKACKENQTLENVVEDAKKQIEAKKYETNLRERGCTNIIKMAFAFKGKDVEFKIFE